MTEEIRWSRLQRISLHGGSKAVADDFASMHDSQSTNPYFLFSYMVVLYKAGRCREALIIYEELKEFCWNYQMELIAGDACRQVQRYDEALEHYETAGNMCPVRFAPLSGMLETYIADNRYGKADSVARRILNKRVKVESYKVCIVKNKAKKWLKSRS